MSLPLFDSWAQVLADQSNLADDIVALHYPSFVAAFQSTTQPLLSLYVCHAHDALHCPAYEYALIQRSQLFDTWHKVDLKCLQHSACHRHLDLQKAHDFAEGDELRHSLRAAYRLEPPYSLTQHDHAAMANLRTPVSRRRSKEAPKCIFIYLFFCFQLSIHPEHPMHRTYIARPNKDVIPPFTFNADSLTVHCYPDVAEAVSRVHDAQTVCGVPEQYILRANMP